jgi:type IV pilus assembly protein PilY1
MKRTIEIIIILLAFIMASPQALLADDTEIYGSVQISVKPNVLIVFDTSGSMGTADIPSEPYEPATDYSSYGSRGKDKVYKKDGSSWDYYASDISKISCQAAKEHMLTRGWTTYKLKGGPSYGCDTDTTKQRFRIGNYLNFLDMPGVTLRKRTDVAKEVIVNLIDSVDNVNFGLMRFNYEHGGRLVKPVGTSKADLKAAVQGLPASGWTPLAETLAEAGLYFAGKKSWYNEGSDSKSFTENGDQYTSPMQYSCQKNYIILMTDGFSTKDKADQLWKTDDTKFLYINGDYLGGDLDGDKNDCDKYVAEICDGPLTAGSDGTDFLDDVAKYLYDNDVNASLGAAGDQFEKQNVTTFTVGFQTDFQLLADAATNGGGEHYHVIKAVDLVEAFESIMSLIIDENAVFVAPVVPVNRMNRAFAGDFLYLGFFRPKSDGNWSGNLKKFGLNSAGEMVDKKGDPATDSTGRILLESSSYWSVAVDGPDVETGGAGEALSTRVEKRDLYTYIENPSVAPAVADLTDTKNKFADNNSEITDALLGNPAEGKTAVINRVHGEDRTWDLSDILHSEPKVLHYWDTDDGDLIPEDGEILSFIFVGANDGMLHAFKDSSGKEEWGFIPPDKLGKLKLMLDSDTDHDYFVDGSPMAYERWDVALDDTIVDNDKEDPGEAFKLLFFGERRGGDYYYALDVSNPIAPSFLYKIDPLHLSDTDNDGTADLSGADLGQSWVKPR